MTLHVVQPAYEDLDGKFCRRCGSKLAIDIGGTLYGHVTGVEFCLDCGVQPEAVDWASLRYAIDVVKARREA